MERRKRPITQPGWKPELVAVSLTALVLIMMFQNMSFVEFVKLNISPVNETARRNHSKELLGDRYNGSPAQKIESQGYLNYFVLREVKRSLSPEWQDYVPQLVQVIIEESRLYDLDPIFVLAIIQTESRFNPNTVGTSGEIGLMQILPKTGEWIAKKYELPWSGSSMLYNPIVNVKVGIRYFALLRKKFDRSAYFYLPAYNMGPLNVMRLNRDLASADDTGNRIKFIYSSKVMANYDAIYKRLGAYTGLEL
jgi:soluble lytic murein transglycosylase